MVMVMMENVNQVSHIPVRPCGLGWYMNKSPYGWLVFVSEEAFGVGVKALQSAIGLYSNSAEEQGEQLSRCYHSLLQLLMAREQSPAGEGQGQAFTLFNQLLDLLETKMKVMDILACLLLLWGMCCCACCCCGVRAVVLVATEGCVLLCLLLLWDACARCCCGVRAVVLVAAVGYMPWCCCGVS